MERQVRRFPRASVSVILHSETSPRAGRATRVSGGRTSSPFRPSSPTRPPERFLGAMGDRYRDHPSDDSADLLLAAINRIGASERLRDAHACPVEAAKRCTATGPKSSSDWHPNDDQAFVEVVVPVRRLPQPGRLKLCYLLPGRNEERGHVFDDVTIVAVR